MFQKRNLTCFAISMFYVLILWRLSLPQPVFRIIVPVFLVFCLGVGYYNKSYLQGIQKYNGWIVMRSMLLFVSGFVIFSLLPTPVLRGLFLASAFCAIMLLELSLGNFAENLLINETLIIIFGLFVGLCAAAQYFPDLHQISVKLGGHFLLNWQFSLLPLYLAGVFVVAMLLGRAFYEFIPQSRRTKWVAAVTLGLFCAEAFWALTFLPFHYSAQAVILFSVFYFCLILNYYHLFHTLTIKKIQFHLALILLACGIVIIATPWKVIT